MYAGPHDPGMRVNEAHAAIQAVLPSKLYRPVETMDALNIPEQRSFILRGKVQLGRADTNQLQIALKKKELNMVNCPSHWPLMENSIWVVQKNVL